MTKQVELNNRMKRNSSQREIKSIWNNVQIVNHMNQFVPTTVLTRTGKILVNTARASGTNNVSTARHNFNRQAVPTNAAMKVNTVKPIVNRVRPATLVLLGEKGKLLLSPQQVVIGDNKDTTGTKSPNTMVYQVYLVKGNIVRGLPSKIFQNDHTCVACQKGKQHKASWKGPTWLFDLGYLTDSMNYQPVRLENQANKHAGPQEANHNAGTKYNINAGDSEKEDESAQDFFVLPIWSSYSSTIKRSTTKDAGEAPNKHPDLKTDEKPIDKEDQVFLDELKRLKRQEKDANDATKALRKEFAQETKDLLLQAGAAKTSSTNIVNTASTPVSTVSPSDGLSFSDPTNPDQDDSEIPKLEDIYKNSTDGIFINSSYDDEGAVADFTNLETFVNVSPIPTSRINSIHPSTLILGDPQSVVQTRSKVTKSSRAHAFVSYIQKQRRNNHKDFQHCLFACFLSQNEPTRWGLSCYIQSQWELQSIQLSHEAEENDQSDFWSNQQDWKIVTWRLYEACGVCILEFEDGTVIHMLVEKYDPLSKVFNSPCFMVKSWLVQDQTVLGKDYSNLLIADSLLKTIWFINAPCYGNEALASPKANELTIPEQTATGKGTSNPFMAGSLPKTTKPT
ncbi:hypothetical protein Tco_0971267 [Tanacetum coccineum]